VPITCKNPIKEIMLAKQRRSNAEQSSELQLRSSTSKAKAKENKNVQPAARVPLRRSAKDNTAQWAIDNKEEEEEADISNKDTKRGKKRSIKLITPIEDQDTQQQTIPDLQVVDLTLKQSSGNGQSTISTSSEFEEIKRENAYLKQKIHQIQQLQQLQSQQQRAESKSSIEPPLSIHQSLIPPCDHQSLLAQQPQEVSNANNNNSHMQQGQYLPPNTNSIPYNQQCQHQHELVPQFTSANSLPQQVSLSEMYRQQLPYQPISHPSNFHAPAMQFRPYDQIQVPTSGAYPIFHPISSNGIGQSNLTQSNSGLHALISTNNAIARGHSTYEGRVAFQEFSNTLLSGLNYYFHRS